MIRLKTCRPMTKIAALQKLAELGGNGDDQQFEQAMSSIAHTYIRSQAPALLDYEVGFQILDKNQESTKVVGITGFKVGREWLYAPTFFLSGKVKGHELLYIKSLDQFVPLKEDWVNSIMKQRPSLLGQGMERDDRYFKPSSPDFRTMFRPPKLASAGPDIHPDLLPGAAAFADAATDDPFDNPKYAGVCDLPAFLVKEGKAAVHALVNNLIAHPELAEAFAKEYSGLGIIDDAIKAANARESLLNEDRARRPAVKKADNVVVVLREEFELAPSDGLSDTEKEDLLRRGVVIRDGRPDNEVTRAYEDDLEAVANPTSSGVYQVLLEDGGFEEAFVGVAPKNGNGTTGKVVVVAKGDPRRYKVMDSDKVFVREGKVEDWLSWWKGLPDVTEDALHSADSGAKFMVIGLNGCSIPFRRGYQDADLPRVDVCFDYCSSGRKGGLPLGDTERDHWSGDEHIRVTPKGSNFRHDDGTLFVPEGFKLLKLESGYETRDAEDYKPLALGKLNDLKRLIFGKTAALELRQTGGGYSVDGRWLSNRDALVHMVRDLGLREKTAAAVLEKVVPGRVNRFLLEKSAAPDYPLQRSAPTSPSFLDQNQSYSDPHGHTVEPPQEQWAPMDFARGSEERLPDRIDEYTAQTAVRAQQAGQREVMDMAMLASTLKSMRDDSMIDRHIPDLRKGLDRLGRIYFSLCWHGDVFQRRFGRQDMVELEDGLRNTFEHLGDIVLALQQKTVEPYKEEFSTDLDDVSS